MEGTSNNNNRNTRGHQEGLREGKGLKLELQLQSPEQKKMTRPKQRAQKNRAKYPAYGLGATL